MKRTERVDWWLATAQRKKLLSVWVRFQAALNEHPRNQTEVNRLRRQMPPWPLNSPLWDIVLDSREVRILRMLEA